MFKKYLLGILTLLLGITNLKANHNNYSLFFNVNHSQTLVHTSKNSDNPFYSPYEKESKKLYYSDCITFEIEEENEEENTSEKHQKYFDDISFISQIFSFQTDVYTPKARELHYKNYLNKKSLRLHLFFEVFII